MKKTYWGNNINGLLSLCEYIPEVARTARTTRAATEAAEASLDADEDCIVVGAE